MQLSNDESNQTIANAKIRHEKLQDDMFYFLERHYPFYYLDKIKKYCDSKQIKIVLLYLPSMGWPEKKPFDYDRLKHIGDMIISETAYSNDAQYWAEKDHLNKKGAKAVSMDIANYILAKDKETTVSYNH